MSDDLRRRRRLGPSGPRRPQEGRASWTWTILAGIAVVILGWFVGSALARFANSPKKSTATMQTRVAVSTPAPSLASAATPSPSPSPSSTPRPSATPSTRPTSRPTATPAATASPFPVPSATPQIAQTPARRRTLPVARRFETPQEMPITAPPATVAPAPENAATTVVRAYIEALRNGDPATAGSYLANGSPDETFIGAGTRITDVSSVRNADGSYSVSVGMQSGAAAYRETFIVAQMGNGTRILSRSTQRP